MKQNELDLYTDYLITSFGQATATGLSALLDGPVSHDTITRFLSPPELGSKALWKQVKPVVREMPSEAGILIIDDTIESPTWTRMSWYVGIMITAKGGM